MKSTRKRIKKWDDGDSGVFVDGTPFRLARVRAPEKHQYGGSTATRRAAGMTAASNKWVNFKQIARDRYGRVVGEMSNKYGSVNDKLLRRGSKNKGR